MRFRHSFPSRSSFLTAISTSPNMSLLAAWHGGILYLFSVGVVSAADLCKCLRRGHTLRVQAGPYLPPSYVHYKRRAYFSRPERHLVATVDEQFFCSLSCHLVILAPLSHSSSLFRWRDGHSAKRHDPHNVIYAPSFAVACSLPATVLASLARGYHGSTSAWSARSPCLSLFVNL